ncbi:FliH/SctL family protein [Brevibacillus laterosporus]|nr:FliH/SctL family protein [Brevibacillus laterosporus]MED1718948.1 FliH/SctL family protein [Brevibacillus laterosporus]
MADASTQAEQMREQARQEIAEWWEQQQKEAEEMAKETKEMARVEGYTLGQEQGLENARLEQEENVQKAKDVLTQAYQTKESIIAEAEPFLVELSLEISRKIIHDELVLAPEKVVEIVRQALKSSRSHGVVSILVNHKLYPFVEEHREQLLSLIDGQAELGIYPDYAVEDEGCIIRTAYGSVDAKIDTQLKEIKQILMDVARGSESQ